MQKTKLSVAIALLTTSPFALAEGDDSFYGFTGSASVALTTDYVWRGVSQTRNDPAIQGSFDISHESGFYAGVWGSNVEFGDTASLELDIYGGFSNDVDFGFGAITYDLGWLRYEYPSEAGLNFNELYFGLGFSPIENLNMSAYYYYGLRIENTNPGDYREFAMDYTLPDEMFGFTILGSVGHYDVTGGGDDYWNWKIGVAKDIAGFNFEVAYTETDDTGATDSSDDSKIVATISKELGGSADSAAMLPDGFETSASVALTTDYVWRGVSQTRNDPAIQGSFDIAHESGFYAGVWGSNVEFGDTTSLELDIYGGFSNDVDFGFGAITYDLGWLRYEYPSEAGLNFNELYFGLGFSPIDSLNMSAYYYYGLRIENTNPGDYREFAMDYTLPDELFGVTILGSVGHYDVTGGGDDYWNWKMGAGRDFGPFNLEVAYTETDDIGDTSSADDAKVVGTISTSF